MEILISILTFSLKNTQKNKLHLIAFCPHVLETKQNELHHANSCHVSFTLT